jgi:acetoin utilization deacetylase AcuC-like enzyme
VDWDVHHGNGTQAIFFNDPHVLYFSVHRFHSGHYFPFQKYGGPSIVGSGKGIGFTVNVGWNQREMGDVEYLAVWHQVLLPIAEEFQPDLVLVSAGFDAAEECKVTPSCFGKLTEALLSLANGKVVCSLEGGYVRSILCQCVESVIESLLMKNSTQKHNCKQPMVKDCIGDALECIDRSAAQSIRSTIACHKEHWNCFKDHN